MLFKKRAVATLLTFALVWSPLLAQHSQAPSTPLLYTLVPAAQSSSSTDDAISETSYDPKVRQRGVRNALKRKVTRERPSMRPFTKIAIGFKADTLGAGVEFATPFWRHLNFRAGINVFDYAYPFNVDGVNYNTGFHLKSAQASIDWFPGHTGFHISPGLIYMKNKFGGSASVPMGANFTLGDQAFTNSIDDPANGTATLVTPRKLAPALTLGWGNLLPRSGRHFSVPFEIGAAYSGQSRVDVKLHGTACTPDGCFDLATEPGTLKNLADELKPINDNLAKYPIYPIISIGFGYRF